MKIVEVANKMFATMKEKGHATRTLENGLRVSLFNHVDEFVLVMERPASLVTPSAVDISIVKEAFFGDRVVLREVPGSIELDGIGHVVYANRMIYMAIEKVSSIIDAKRK